MLKIAELNLYPLKSCAQISLDQAAVGPLGLEGDRRWMVVDPNGRFMTGREQPKLLSIRAQPSIHGIGLSARGCKTLDVPFPDAGMRRPVQVWSSQVIAAWTTVADAWLSALLGAPATLVYMDKSARRPTDPRYSQAHDQVSFADGFPVLLTTKASLADLNARLDTPVGMERFRANIVVSGDLEPYQEDHSRGFEIDGLRFDNVKPCARCVFTTLDAKTLIFDPAREPLKTLSTYRRAQPGKILFGVNLIARQFGTLHVGAPVRLLD